MRRIIMLILLLLQKASTLHAINANERFRTNSSNLRSFDSSTKVYHNVVQSATSFIKNDSGKVSVVEELDLLQTKVDEVLDCCRNKCPGKSDIIREEICNGKLTIQTASSKPKTVKMVLPTRQCILCPCSTTSTSCPVMPADHCPCNVQIGHLLPCPISSGTFQVRSRRRKRQMTEVVVPADDKSAIEYLRKLGYVEESNLSPANICHPSNSPKTAAVIPIAMEPYQAVLPAQQQIPIQLLPNLMLQQPAFDGINGMQLMNLAFMQQQQQEKQQGMVPSRLNEQSKLTNLLASQSDNQLNKNDDCQFPRRTKSAATARSRIIFIVLAVIVWIRLSQECNI